MAYTWSNEVTQYPTLRLHFAIADNAVAVDLAGAISGDEHTPAEAAALMGKIKDALEAADLNVGTIYLDGLAWQTLTEV